MVEHNSKRKRPVAAIESPEDVGGNSFLWLTACERSDGSSVLMLHDDDDFYWDIHTGRTYEEYVRMINNISIAIGW